MKHLLLTLLALIISGCSAHIIGKYTVLPKDSDGWTPSSTSQFTEYSCNTFKARFQTRYLGERNLTNSIFWMPVIPTTKKKPYANQNLYLIFDYVNKAVECSIDDVVIEHNDVQYFPIEVKSFGKTLVLNTSCEYIWDMKFHDIKEFEVIMSNDRCQIPPLKIELNEDLSYEDNPTAW